MREGEQKSTKTKQFRAAHGRRARPESTYDPKAHI